jgi:Fanconi-associated nuclease 1-like protein
LISDRHNYYHDHFVEMLSFVRTTYGSILTDEHDAFVLRFQSLSKDAQCLLTVWSTGAARSSTERSSVAMC